MWEQYEATGDLAFLKKAFPFMEATAQFLLAYQQVGTDGLLHAVANAHETQWAVQDPTTDIAADQALFPIIADRRPRSSATDAAEGPAARPVRDGPHGDPAVPADRRRRPGRSCSTPTTPRPRRRRRTPPAPT